MKKFSLAPRFARLALLALITLFLLTLTGRAAALSGDPASCAGWPLCVPQGLEGWVHLIHRFAVAASGLSMIALFQQAWTRLRDNRILLPWATVTVTLYFAQVFIGAMQVERGFPAYLVVMHSLTAVAVWVGAVGLVIAAGLYAGDGLVTFPPLDWWQRSRDFLALTKPIIVVLLLVTTFAGMVAGGQGWPSLHIAFWTLLGGALAAGGSGALNQYIDRDLDKHMQRTAKRPMAAGRMTPAEGLAFGLGTSIVSFYIFVGFVNMLAALLSLAGIIYYVILYSILLKKATVQNIVIGGGAGAIPPMVGWAAATGRLDMTAYLLFAIIFFWTPPHFWALAIVRAKDYARAGVPMLPVVRGEKETRWQIFIYTIGLVALTLVVPVFGLTGSVYLVSALLFGGGLIYAAWRVYRIEGNKVAWQMYRYSSMYLAFIFLALMVDALV